MGCFYVDRVASRLIRFLVGGGVLNINLAPAIVSDSNKVGWLNAQSPARCAKHRPYGNCLSSSEQPSNPGFTQSHTEAEGHLVRCSSHLVTWSGRNTPLLVESYRTHWGRFVAQHRAACHDPRDEARGAPADHGSYT